MKNKLFVILLFLVINQLQSQSEIKNPNFSYSAGEGTVTKVELLENATVLHFDITLYTNKACHIPSSSYIQPVNSDKKYFVTHGEGIVLDEEFEVHGKLRKKYKLFFPKLPEGVTHVKFDEFEHGYWEIHDLEIRSFQGLPKELVGDWLLADGSNLWHHSFYNNKVIIDKAPWQYKSIKKEGKLYTIILENKSGQKTVYAEIKDKNTVRLGARKKRLITYTSKNIFNKKYKFENDIKYTEANIIKSDSAIYSGIIANYTKASNYKTGTISVNNVFTGTQETYLVRINEDGSFRVKFPLYYPQSIFVRFPHHYPAVFVEPGKETWHLISSNKYAGSSFVGETAHINSELTRFMYPNRGRNSYKTLTKNIYNTSPEDYKKRCDSMYKSNIKLLDSVVKNKSISKKGLQVMRLDLKYRHLGNLLDYDMNTRSRDKNKKAKYETDSTYLDFLTPELMDDKLAVLSSSFSSIINRLSYSKHIRSRKGVAYPQGTELATVLKEKGVDISKEEEALISSQIEFKKKTAVAIKKQEEFVASNKKTLASFNQKFNKVYQKTAEGNRKNLFNKEGYVLDTIFEYAKEFEIAFSKEEVAVINAQNNVLTAAEKQENKDFYTEALNTKNRSFMEKHQGEIQLYISNKYKEQSLESYINFFGSTPSWVSDIIICQKIAGPIKDQFTPLSNSDLKKFSNYITDPFVKEQLHAINKNTLAEIEANKTKTGYVVNETPDTEADKVFDAIIEKYKGKVVFVDFWATWCGPCRSGMTKMIPLKEELKNEDIVFVYITNPTSPKKTYANMIPNIEGEHYRVSSDDWNYLKDKFKISGIPHYTLVNKEGEVVNKTVRFSSSNSELKKIFKKHL